MACTGSAVSAERQAAARGVLEAQSEAAGRARPRAAGSEPWGPQAAWAGGHCPFPRAHLLPQKGWVEVHMPRSPA